jgi:hypothetical protein
MAASTLTYTKVASTVWGDKQVRIYDITFSDGYVTDGFALAASSFGLVAIDAVIATSSGDATGDLAVLAAYDKAHGKLALFVSAGDGDLFDQAASDKDISDVSVTVLVVGH